MFINQHARREGSRASVRRAGPVTWVAVWMIGMLGLFCCGGGSRASSSTGPAPQTSPTISLTAVADPVDFDKFTLAWSAQGSPDGYQLAYQIDGGGYEPMHTDMIPTTVNLVEITFDSATPERLTFGFRISAMKGGQVQAQTETSYRRSLRPAQGFSLTPKPEKGTILASWTKASESVATGFILERGTRGGDWTTLDPPLVSPGGDYSSWDSSRAEGEAHSYRVVPTFGSERGMPVLATTQMPPKAPTALVASPSGQGFQLSWVNQSQVATSIRINRVSQEVGQVGWSAPLQLGVLPSTATTFLDPAPPSNARWAYQVVAVREGFTPAPSRWCLAGGPGLLADLGMARTTLSLPFAPLARGGDGAWYGIFTLFGPTQVFMWTETVPFLHGFSVPVPLSLGLLSYPTHTFSAQAGGAGTVDLRVTESTGSFGAMNTQVLRFSGGTWQRHAHASPQGLSLGSGRFASDGSFRAFAYDSAFQAGLFQMLPDGTATTQFTPGMPRGERWGPFETPSGNLVTLHQDSVGWYQGVRTPGGNWSFHLLSGADPAVLRPFSCRGVQVDAQGVLHAIFAAEGPELRVDYLRVAADGTAQVQNLCTGLNAYTWGRVGTLAITPDGGRIGFAIMDASGVLRTGTKSGTGDWILKTATVPDAAINYVVPFLTCGFLENGRFWVLHNVVLHPALAESEFCFELLEESAAL